MGGGPLWQRNKQIIQPMSPLVEGPDLRELVMQQRISEKQNKQNDIRSSWDVFRNWFRNKKLGSSGGTSGNNTSNSSGFALQYSRSGGAGGKDIRLLLGVLACPLAPIPLLLDHNRCQIELLPNKNLPTNGGLAARYIIQQYLAATGRVSGRNKNYKTMYTTGDVKMTSCETEISTTTAGDDQVTRLGTRSGESGCFVLWMMSPTMWSLELVVGCSKVVAGSDGKIVWRHTPWLGTHAAKGPQRPLRRIIQGLDPNITASLFTKAEYMGEDNIGEDNCFILQVEADRTAIKERSEGSAEVIRHILYGYFSQKSGLLIYLEDSHLTRVANGDDDDSAVYWETTIGSSITDYKAIDGILIAHQGRTIATVFKFGDEAIEYSRTRLEEEWTINDIAFDVQGLSLDQFIPPADIFANLDLSS